MPRKMEDLAWLKNQLRVFIASRHPAPTTRLRAMQMFATLCEFPQMPKKDMEPEVEPEVPATDPRIQAMLEQNRKGGEADANQLSKSSSK